MRRLLGLGGVLGGAVAGTFLYRRSLGRRRDRLDVYFSDGSMVSFVEGAPEADRLLPVVYEALAAARRPPA